MLAVHSPSRRNIDKPRSTGAETDHPLPGPRAQKISVWMALECARLSRDILGAVGITDDYPIMRHMLNLETLKTYKGTTTSTGSLWARTSPEFRPFSHAAYDQSF